MVSDYVLVPSGNEPLPETRLTKVHDAIWYSKMSIQLMIKIKSPPYIVNFSPFYETAYDP